MAPMLLLDNKPANLEHKPSPSRHYPLRGLSEQTRRSVEDPHAIPLPCPRHLRLPSHTPPGHVARSQKSSTGRFACICILPRRVMLPRVRSTGP